MQDDEYKYRAYFPGWLLRYFPAGKTNQIERAELSASLPPRTMWKSWICSMVWSDLGCNLVRSPGPDIKTELSGRPGLRIHRSWSTRTHCISITDCISCTPCIPINNCINCILMITQHVFVSFYRNVSGHIKAEQTKFNRIRWNFMRQFPEVDAWAGRCPVSTAMYDGCHGCRGWRRVRDLMRRLADCFLHFLSVILISTLCVYTVYTAPQSSRAWNKPSRKYDNHSEGPHYWQRIRLFS